MAESNITPADIPEEGPFISPEDAQGGKRYYEVKGFAWFTCQDKSWPSAHAWCFIDLKKQVICFRYTQGCNKCEKKVSPEFSADSIQSMAEFVVRRFTGSWKGGGSDGPRETQGGPHDEGRCSKCEKLGSSCWL